MINCCRFRGKVVSNASMSPGWEVPLYNEFWLAYHVTVKSVPVEALPLAAQKVGDHEEHGLCLHGGSTSELGVTHGLATKRCNIFLSS